MNRLHRHSRCEWIKTSWSKVDKQSLNIFFISAVLDRSHYHFLYKDGDDKVQEEKDDVGKQ